jgi:hypothetical protein
MMPHTNTSAPASTAETWLAEASMIAAQCWQDDETSEIEMDVRLANAFAKRLAYWMAEGARHAANSEFWRKKAGEQLQVGWLVRYDTGMMTRSRLVELKDADLIGHPVLSKLPVFRTISGFNYNYFTQDIESLEESQVFVFGSNLAGFHGRGAAKKALEFGAVYGVGEGQCGKTYGIPTKDYNIKTRALNEIAKSINKFKVFASNKPELTFQVTKVGCGLAGYHDSEIAPMFRGSSLNCLFHKDWAIYLED